MSSRFGQLRIPASHRQVTDGLGRDLLGGVCLGVALWLIWLGLTAFPPLAPVKAPQNSHGTQIV